MQQLVGRAFSPIHNTKDGRPAPPGRVKVRKETDHYYYRDAK
jgi:hypothetical protein